MVVSPSPAVASSGCPPTVKELRHRAEWPLVILGLVLTAVVAALAIAMLANGDTPDEWAMGSCWDS